MFAHHNVLVAVLFVTSMQSSGFASKDMVTSIHGSDKTRIWINRMVRSSRGPWIEGFKSILQTSESSCADEVAILIEAIESNQEWALQMLDASSRLPSGLMTGNFKDVGMYDECVKVNKQSNHVSIRGKHCMVSLGSVAPTSPAVDGLDYLRIFSSLCVPSSCNETHAEQIINSTIANTPAISDLEFEVSEASCARVESDDWRPGEIYTLTFFVAVVALMIVCTICDFARRLKSTEGSTSLNTLAKFSLYTNSLAVLSTKLKPDMVQSIEGIRVLSICWIILGHRFITTFIRPVVNMFEVNEWLHSWASLYILVAIFAVDTFFVMGGFFAVYLLLRTMQSGRKINWPMHYLNRYLRLTPSLAIVMLFVSFLAHRFGNGPVWSAVPTIDTKTCEDNWWVNLLYVQNLVNAKQMCLLPTWYLAADMQLFWISPIIIYPLYRWPKHGIRLLGFFILASIVAPPVVLVINGYSNRSLTMRVDVGKIIVSDFNFYLATYNHASAYFIGMFLGYDVVTKKRQLTKVNVLINWTVTSVFLLFCACATHFNFSSDFAHNRVLEVIIALTLRPCWSIAIAWIIYACSHGYGGPINSFLSLPFFRPLSRLSYSMFLVHFLIQYARNVATRTPVTFSNSLLIYEYFTDLALAIIVAFLFTLFFEAPLAALKQIFTDLKSDTNQVSQMRSKDNELQDTEAGILNKST